MTIAFVVLAAVVASALIYLGTREGRYEVRRSLLMQVDRQTLFDKIRDFPTWADWSPWLLHEPEAKREFSPAPDQEDGWYAWDGRHIGAGRVTHVKLDAPRRIEERLDFVRPFKSTSSAWWELAEKDGATELTWGMRGAMPFLLRPMTPMVKEMIGKDYELGLLMLRGTLDPAAERPQLRFIGETRLPPRSALTIPFAGGLQAMIPAMQQGLPRLAAHASAHGGMSGPLFCAYHKVDPKAKHFVCDIAVPVTDAVPDGSFARKNLGGGKYFQVRMQGSYDFLELAWYNAVSHLRMRKLKLDRSRPYLEVYENDPASVAHPNAIETSLYLPIR